jgi:hypothetical protein
MEATARRMTGGPALDPAPRSARLSVGLEVLLTLLLLAMSLAGILIPSTYARESASSAAQAVGQDWVDLAIAVPWLAFSGAFARGGSRTGRFLLAGGYLYAVYELAIYAFAIHFNALFLVYCAALGVSVLGLVSTMHALGREELSSWFSDRMPRRSAAAVLIAIGVGFGLLWLGDIVPALVRGTTPATVVEARVPTNPVHVMDLSLILPAHVAAGVLLFRRRPLGYLLAPVLLGFGVLMATSIGGMMVVMRLRGVPAALSVVVGMAVLATLNGVVLVKISRALHGRGGGELLGR